MKKRAWEERMRERLGLACKINRWKKKIPKQAERARELRAVCMCHLVRTTKPYEHIFAHPSPRRIQMSFSDSRVFHTV